MTEAYLDHVSATSVLSEVREAMLPWLGERYGNPSSLHSRGQKAREAMDSAREQVAALIGARPDEIIFTSCGTESNNLAVKGLAQASKGTHVLLSAIEHVSVLTPAKSLKRAGFEVETLPVDKYGMVNPADVAAKIRPDTALVSVMLANNEIGTIEPLAEISKITREKGVLLHSDAVAAAGSIPIDVVALGVDALSLAANQFYGPPGAAALWLKSGLKIARQLEGGFQEDGRRAGSENVPALAGMGKAAELARLEMSKRTAHLTGLRDRMLKEIPERVPHTFVTGHPTQRLPGHASFVIQFVEGEGMLLRLDLTGISVSSVSACTSKALKASHVLLAAGIDQTISQGSVVFSAGIMTTNEEIDYVMETLPQVIDRLRQMSPLYAKFLKENK
ncbi:MAG: cysteine desulfurase [Dehalococcoidia bacterium]|nr:cysteine desulfurase [Dehalococcoidia bacterium]